MADAVVIGFYFETDEKCAVPREAHPFSVASWHVDPRRYDADQVSNCHPEYRPLLTWIQCLQFHEGPSHLEKSSVIVHLLVISS